MSHSVRLSHLHTSGNEVQYRNAETESTSHSKIRPPYKIKCKIKCAPKLTMTMRTHFLLSRQASFVCESTEGPSGNIFSESRAGSVRYGLNIALCSPCCVLFHTHQYCSELFQCLLSASYLLFVSVLLSMVSFRFNLKSILLISQKTQTLKSTFILCIHVGLNLICY